MGPCINKVLVPAGPGAGPSAQVSTGKTFQVPCEEGGEVESDRGFDTPPLGPLEMAQPVAEVALGRGLLQADP